MAFTYDLSSTAKFMGRRLKLKTLSVLACSSRFERAAYALKALKIGSNFYSTDAAS
jgi:hypothetical protein